MKPKSPTAIVLLVVMNALTGVEMFDLVPATSPYFKLVAFGVWFCGNLLALFAPAMAKRMPKPKAAVAALVIGALALQGCACFRPSSEKYNSRGCVIARKAVDCTKGAVLDFIMVVGPGIIADLLAGRAPNLREIAHNAEKKGVGWGVCLLAAIDADLGGKPDAAPQSRPVYEALAAHAREVYGPGPIDVKLRGPDGAAPILVSLP